MFYHSLADNLTTLTRAHEGRSEADARSIAPDGGRGVGHFLDLLVAVARPHVVLMIPKRLCAYFVHDRRPFVLLSRGAHRTLQGYVDAALGELDAAVAGLTSLALSFGSLAHWRPNLHLGVADGAFRRDGSFVEILAHEAAVLAEACRRAIQALFVRRDWLQGDG